MDSKLNLIELPCTWTGETIRAYWREGTNDRRILEACIVADEYHFADLLPPPGPHTGDNLKLAIDLGAHIGAATLALISAGYFVRAVEPISDNIAMLRKNIGINGWQPRCAIHPEAFGRSGAETEIYWGGPMEGAPADPALERHRFIGSAAPQQDRANVAEVTTLGITDLLNRWDHCDIIKMDCEGGEWSGFDTAPGGARLRALAKINLLVGELHHGRTAAELLGMLGGGFEDITAATGLGSGPYIVAKRRPEPCPEEANYAKPKQPSKSKGKSSTETTPKSKTRTPQE